MELLASDHAVVAVDNLSNGHKKSVERDEQITGKSLSFVECELLDKPALDEVFSRYQQAR